MMEERPMHYLVKTRRNLEDSQQDKEAAQNDLEKSNKDQDILH